MQSTQTFLFTNLLGISSGGRAILSLREMGMQISAGLSLYAASVSGGVYFANAKRAGWAIRSQSAAERIMESVSEPALKATRL
jgi:hypothetical protein